MKKLFANLPILLIYAFSLFGCGTSGEKIASISIIYSVMAICSLLLLIGYCSVVRKREPWFLLLFISVLIVNTGYAILAVSKTLTGALWANRISYFGSVFLPLSMLMIILDVCKIKYRKIVPSILLTISILVFLVAASPGILDIYYKEVSLEITNGVSSLRKVYGPWHLSYYFYLFGYFGTMIATIFYSASKKRLESAAHVAILAVAVFVNIGVWFIEQFVHINFEILSVSYIMSELFLLSLHFMVQESIHQKELLESAHAIAEEKSIQLQEIEAEKNSNSLLQFDATSLERLQRFSDGVEALTPTERIIYDYYLEKKSTKEILALLNIKENTLKFHNKNIYGKLDVSSRKELLAIAKELIHYK